MDEVLLIFDEPAVVAGNYEVGFESWFEFLEFLGLAGTFLLEVVVLLAEFAELVGEFFVAALPGEVDFLWGVLGGLWGRCCFLLVDLRSCVLNVLVLSVEG